MNKADDLTQQKYYSGGFKATSRLLFSNDDAPVFSCCWLMIYPSGWEAKTWDPKAQSWPLTPGMICVSFILVMNS